MKRPKLWWLDLQTRKNSGQVYWDNEPLASWPLWEPPTNNLTAPGPRPKPQPEIGGTLGKGKNPLNVGTGLPVGIETPRVRLNRTWSSGVRQSICLVGQGRDLLLVSEPVWQVLNEVAPDDVEGIRAEFVDINGHTCPPHWVCDIITFRNLHEIRTGEYLVKSVDGEHEDLGDAMVFRSFENPKSLFFVDELAKRLRSLPLNITRLAVSGEFIDG